MVEEIMLQPLWESRDRYEELKRLDDAMRENSVATPAGFDLLALASVTSATPTPLNALCAIEALSTARQSGLPSFLCPPPHLFCMGAPGAHMAHNALLKAEPFQAYPCAALLSLH
ncbi:hypothetical protein P7K49_032551 [Saguinus oedipus]|uniref:Uncharacterized protein n=1 Tax=Saguinus oedipus TaxID=9490 RepID=A0ABQ9TYJ2_SAGOE|nr:hypothetical protein P7K49_032551 [Saguinus oedipus]